MPFHLPDSAKKTFFLVLAVLIAASALATFLVIANERRHVLETAIEATEHAVELQATYLNRWFERNILEDVRGLTGLSSVRSRNLQAMATDFRALADDRTDLADLVYIDGTGRPRASSSTTDPLGEADLDFSDRDYFKAAQKGEESISPILRSRFDGNLLIIFSVPLFQGQDFDGLILGSVRLAHLANMIQDQRFGKTGRFRLFDGSGQSLENLAENGEGTPLFDAAQVREEGSLTTRLSKASGEQVLRHVRPIAHSGLFVGAELDFAEIYASTGRMTDMTLLSLLLLGGLGVALFSLLFHRLARSLDVVTSDLARASEGDYDAMAEETLAGLPLELRRIGRAIEDLKGRIKTSIAEIREGGIRDSLTGLHNRQFFEESLRRLSRGDDDPVTIVMFDVNGLKLVNDGLGHLWGDRLLEKAATILREVAGPDDIVARIGGDEFVLILPRSDDERERQLEERLKARLREREGAEPESEEDIPLYMAWGLARGHGAVRSLDEVLKDADEKMYARKETRRADTQRAILDVFLRQIHNKERRRINHMERCEALMEAFLLSLPEIKASFRERMTRLASLHDIGFVGIDADIVGKQGPLNEEEWRAIRSHPEIGYRIAAAVPHLADLAEAILHHHQRWDGKGYPLRDDRPLVGEAIPLESRIMSLVDAYEAMTGCAYAPPKSHREALAEIDRCSGTQFDPQWAETFIQFLQDWRPA